MVDGDAAVVMYVKCENPGALPPFLVWEGVECWIDAVGFYLIFGLRLMAIMG